MLAMHRNRIIMTQFLTLTELSYTNATAQPNLIRSNQCLAEVSLAASAGCQCHYLPLW